MVPSCTKTDSTDSPPVVKDPYGMFEYTRKANGVVTFFNTSTDATSYLWDFGDGQTSTTAVMTFDHQYLQNGNYYVLLTAYGNGKSDGAYANVNITTVVGGVPTVETDSVTNITQTTATSGGNVTSEGGSTVTARGVCWSRSQNPTLSDSKTTDGSGTGSFTSDITGLAANTPYYVRAYATNSSGTGYGNQVIFRTGGQGCPGVPTVTDSRDGQVYPTVKIGDQCWLQKNMNYQTGNSWCWDNNTSNCDTYGRLYDWETALGVCPSGWHLPSDNEWTVLTDFLGGYKIAGGKMKEAGTTHWLSPNTEATNSSEFTALPGGSLGGDGFFYMLNANTFFWSSVAESDTMAFERILYYNLEECTPWAPYKKVGISVRCIKD